MVDLIQQIIALREECRSYGDRVQDLLGVSLVEGDPRSACFGMIFNHSTLVLELLDHYYHIWGRPPAQLREEQVEEARRENWERCNELLKAFFIMSMSSIEYSAKASLARYGHHPLASSLARHKGRFLYLSHIIDNSTVEHLVDGSVQRDWNGLIAIRNCVVHNNAKAEHTENYVIGELTVPSTKGVMLQGRLDFFAALTEVAVNRYFAWVTAIIERCTV